MEKKRFEDVKGIDDDIRQAMLDRNNGRPPDNFIEDAQGGGVDSDVLAQQDPKADQAIMEALDKELAEMGADVSESGQLRHD